MIYNDIRGTSKFWSSRTKRILVCGSRDFNGGAYTDTQVYDKLTQIRNEYLGQCLPVVIQGWGSGVDLAAAQWAEFFNYPFLTVPADWDQYGKLAGPYRNQLMLDLGNPDIVIAFPGGKGTKDMKTRAEERGIEIIEIEF